MKCKSRTVRKTILINPLLLERVKKIFKVSSESKAIEMALKEVIQRKIVDDKVWAATHGFINHLRKHKIKPLFN